MNILFKLVLFVSFIFCSSLFYFGFLEYKKFLKEEEYFNSSIFEKIIINSIVFFFFLFLSMFLFVYANIIFNF